MRRAAVLVGKPVAFEPDQRYHGQHEGRKEPHQPARLGVVEIDQPRRGLARAQQQCAEQASRRASGSGHLPPE